MCMFCCIMFIESIPNLRAWRKRRKEPKHAKPTAKTTRFTQLCPFNPLKLEHVIVEKLFFFGPSCPLMTTPVKSCEHMSSCWLSLFKMYYNLSTWIMMCILVSHGQPRNSMEMTKARDPGRFSNSCFAKSTEITSVGTIRPHGNLTNWYPKNDDFFLFEFFISGFS